MASGGRSEESARGRVGLCWDCRWARRVESARGALFFLCRRAETESGYPKYPPLPRVRCAGYETDPSCGPTAEEGRGR